MSIKLDEDITSRRRKLAEIRSKLMSETEEIRSRIRIKIKAYDHKIIDQSAKQIIEAAHRSGVNVAGPVPLPTEIRKYNVNKSTFV